MAFFHKLRNAAIICCCSIFLAAAQAIPAAASIPAEEMALGGISIGAAADYVKSVYGQPDKISYSDGVLYYYYGDNFALRFMRGNLYRNRTPSAITVTVSGANGLSTPSGLSVGLSVDALAELYGESDNYEAPAEANGWCDVYIYYSDGAAAAQNMAFYIREGMIVKMECAYRV